ncbi:RagB/SusD family nutrient uptake outer membrane protein [Catalinimonas niigatensis]|uniref:RagB/SusD family nutrient uptake outer membrane protein n=1 Tax=Catalinimonas niigatensis TaxID=1397264 RepID=UPI0026652685|nr:RagB/SusD family nutrient uptake outer membrane protein [Catalinimonas niigatensis]WPP50424.1 RagB/SusD family nutrient uptake outer membrane protein [Catalinimonas niigatensis]
MKNILLLLTLFLMVGCDDYLEEEPVSFLSDAQFYQTENDAIAAVNAAYQPFATNAYYGQQFFVQVEMKAEYCLGRGSHQPPGVYQLDQGNIERIAGIWRMAYLSINRANATLARVPAIEMDEDLKTRVLAEAHFVRALNYFNLVRLWGPVPLQQEEISTIVPFSFPRTPVDAIYDLIMDDLEQAEQGLRTKSEQSAPAELFRATLGAAQTLLAHVYLTRERYEEALAKAQEVMVSGEYSLEPDLLAIYDVNSQTNSEEVFSIKFSRIDGLGSGMPPFIHNANAGYSSSGFRTILGNTNSFLSSWDADDLRRNLNLYNTPFDSTFLTASEPILFKKYIDSEAQGNHGNDFPVYRLPDAMYMYAEADIRSDGTLSAQGLEYINMIRRRAYGQDINTPDPAVDFASGLSSEEYLDIIFDERGKEFMLEDKRWFDMLRYDRVEALLTASGFTYSPNVLLWPIPQEEIDNNEALTQADQNPGY